MRLTVAPMLALLAVAACGERADAPASTEAPTSDARPGAPIVLSAADLRRVCRAGLANIHGQALDAIQIDGVEGKVINASWRAPVDGGRRRAQCRTDNDLLTWKQVDSPTPEQNRWMNQSGDPVTRFVLDGETITINTTLPDGTNTTDDYTVAAEQEAR